MTHALGCIEAIYIAPATAAPMQAVDRVRTTAGRGLEGDRYFTDGDRTPSPDSQLTLIDAEVLDALEREMGIHLGRGEHRRNLVIRGVRLEELVGKRFSVGEVQCVGMATCEPCAHMEELTGQPGVIKGLVHRGGLRAGIVTDGEVSVGDTVAVLPAPPPL